MMRLFEYAIVRIVLFVMGALGAILRAFPEHHRADEIIPVVDGVTLAWVGLAVLGLLLPVLKTLSLGVISVSFRDEHSDDGRSS
jgi:hypothetical protein